MNELKHHVTPGLRTEFVQMNINIVGDELVELAKKESRLSRNIKTYQEFVIELNRIL